MVIRLATRAVATQVSRVIPLRMLVHFAGSPLIVLFHTVSDAPLPHVRHLYEHKRLRDFERDLDYLLKAYRPVDLDDLLQAVHKPLSPHSLFVTFDDGLRQVYEIIAPILKRKGVPAAFFLPSGFLDNKDLFYRFKASLLIERLTSSTRGVDEQFARKLFRSHQLQEEDLRASLLRVTYQQRALLDEIASAWGVSFEEFLAKERPFMTSAQVEDLLRDGFHFGGHSIDHPRFDSLLLQEQLFQTEECMRFLITKFHLRHKIFSFPFSAQGVSDDFYRLAVESGLVEAFFGADWFGISPEKRLFERLPLDQTSIPSLKQKYLHLIMSKVQRPRRQ